MSEYQYYEFRAIDRPLNTKQMAELRDLSSRAEITATSFTNTYNYGDFRGDPEALMDRYFDAFVYVANWGTHQLMFRITRDFLDLDRVKAYCDGEILSLTVRPKHVVLEFRSDDEGDYDWTEGEPWLPALVSIRDELIRGDYRALYLGWLASLPPGTDWGDDVEETDAHEPPVPSGLAKLSSPLRSLAEFLRIDDALIDVAAKGSAGEAAATPSRPDLERWVEQLPVAEKNAYLARFLAEDGDVLLRAELARRLREATASRSASPGGDANRRTIAELLEARDAWAEKKSRREAQRAARERERKAREQAEARARHLDDLAQREPAAWREVDQLIATRQPKPYDQAVALLVDLRDLAARSGRTDEAAARIRELRRQHSSKSSLLRRFDKHDLGR